MKTNVATAQFPAIRVWANPAQTNEYHTFIVTVAKTNTIRYMSSTERNSASGALKKD